MQDELYRLVDTFSQHLSQWEYNQYVSKIRDYFIPYLISEKTRAKDVEDLFRNELTPSDIIESCKRYILTNDGVTSESSIDDFLIAINQFFDMVLTPLYPNRNLIELKPFNKLGKEVLNLVSKNGKILQKAFKFQTITGDQYNYLLLCLHKDNFSTLKDKQVQIIIELILLYGFSIGRIQNFKKDNIKESGRYLALISSKYSMPRNFILELPLEVSKHLCSYLKSRENDSVDWLFITDECTQIQASFTWLYFKEIKKALNQSGKYPESELKRLNNTGLSMYAIDRMLEKGFGASLIMDLTGQGQNIISSCQNEIYSNNQPQNQNSYINCKLREIDTYDEFQQMLL